MIHAEDLRIRPEIIWQENLHIPLAEIRLTPAGGGDVDEQEFLLDEIFILEAQMCSALLKKVMRSLWVRIRQYDLSSPIPLSAFPASLSYQLPSTVCRRHSWAFHV